MVTIPCWLYSTNPAFLRLSDYPVLESLTDLVMTVFPQHRDNKTFIVTTSHNFMAESRLSFFELLPAILTNHPSQIRIEDF